MLPIITPTQAQEMVQSGEARLIDIRESTEYAAEFIPGSRLVPLSIARNYPLKDSDAPEKPVIFFCHSGNRTQKAAPLLEELAGSNAAYQIEGGITGWKQAGLSVQQNSAPLPLFRQIQIGAGALVLAGVIGSAFWHPMYLLSAFVGAGLMFAGITGFCGLGILLSKMPWNKN